MCKMSVIEMVMWEQICGHTKHEQIRNRVIHNKVRVAPTENLTCETQLRWLDYVRWRSINALVKRVDENGRNLLQKR